MANVQVDSLRFDFAPGMVAEKYDEWHYYREVLQQAAAKGAWRCVAD